MGTELKTLEERLDQAVLRIERLEQSLPNGAEAVVPWKYLVSRPHPWRKQLSIKGRNLTVGQLLATLRANQLTPEQASEDLDLPLEAVQEALEYAGQNKSLLELEACEERRRLMERGYRLEPENLPG